MTSLGSSSQAVTLKAKVSTIQQNTNIRALLAKAVNLLKKTTCTVIEKQVKKNWQKYNIKVLL